MGRFSGAAALVALALTLAGCGGMPQSAPSPSVTATPFGAPSPSMTATPWDAPFAHVPADEIDEALRDELLQMLEEDQAERLEGADFGGDRARTERLAEILAEHGWPGQSLVGEEAEDAAWAIAQHADHDHQFQKLALLYLAAAVKAGDASLGNLAYLSDRIAVAEGKPQTYGTQMACGEDGPAPVTPIAGEESVDRRRADAGLPPLADYYAEMAAVCAEDF